jgi:hypothetical protein
LKYVTDTIDDDIGKLISSLCRRRTKNKPFYIYIGYTTFIPSIMVCLLISRISIFVDKFYFKASLRPPAENQTMQTNGRKSSKKAKKIKDAAAVALVEDADDDGTTRR